jgi:hypothetical protein
LESVSPAPEFAALSLRHKENAFLARTPKLLAKLVKHPSLR